MKIKRYFAMNMREAIRKVREEQGPDAVILSNRRVEGGVEIMAALDYDESLFAARELESSRADSSPGANPLSGPTVPPPARAPARSASSKPEARVKAGPNWAGEPGIAAVREEISSIRDLLEHQLSGLAWGELGRRKPQRAALLRRLLELDINAPLAREITAEVGENGPFDAAWRKALAILAHRIRVQDDSLLTEGGVVALVGATGVGKTTTVAKLAARFALRHGAEQVGLVTTDGYRVGAVEQLRTYGRIMGIPVRVTRGQEELRAALEDLYERRLVLIDTAGMSQRDIRLTEQLVELREGAPSVQTYLVLSATSQRQGLEETVYAFRRVDLEGCIVTKLDEAAGLGSVLSVAIQQQLPVAYVSDGQRVPEDIRPARAHHLVSKAVKAAPNLRNDSDESLELAYGGMAASGHL